ncbi:acyl-CoA dehydrogenase family protein [Tuwongella immobilis]|uniref:acyl-CoA dehydrogenase family protein n=1 Tax=Tuwongella immobilis TaxID=692036 RepID=UPI001E5A6236|nr:acyl-CoA dehydrogenase family protein [Tuwongella immobilis]
MELDSILAHESHRADTQTNWPKRSWERLTELGCMRWSIPTAYGGDDLSGEALMAGYEAIAASCLTTAFCFSQREAAVRRIRSLAPPAIREEWLPDLARGQRIVTVGLSQLSTSRQHRAPALLATALGNPDSPECYRLHGDVPWVTAADQSDAMVIGACLEDGQQVLFLVPTDLPGVTIDSPMELTALLGSRTASVHFDAVEIPRHLVLAGPAPQLLGPMTGGGLETSCLALGLVRASVGYLAGESRDRPHLNPIVERFETHLQSARRRLLGLVRNTLSSDAVLSLRASCTRLALRATQAVLTVAKGAGFVAPHPAARWARQALFFLVWSCPQPTATALLTELTPPVAVN